MLFPPNELPKPNPKPRGLGAWWTGALLNGICRLGLLTSAGDEERDGEADMWSNEPAAVMALADGSGGQGEMVVLRGATTLGAVSSISPFLARRNSSLRGPLITII